jgi:hypothetical protein
MQASTLEEANLAETEAINELLHIQDNLASIFMLVQRSTVSLSCTARWLIRL